MAGALKNRYRAALAGGLVCKHKADAESIFYFDPANAAHAALTVKLIGARRKRQPRTLTDIASARRP